MTTPEPTAWDPLDQQRRFRRLLDAFARPAEASALAVVPSAAPAWLLALAMLCDREVSLADPDGLLAPRERRLLQASDAAPGDGRFVLVDGRAPAPPGFSPRLGTLDSPELGATIVLVCGALGRGALCLAASGPGVPGVRRLSVGGLDRSWLERRAGWVARFPLGADLLLADATHVAALPRTTRVELEVA